MILRELINNVNEILSENLKKNIVNTANYGYKYDQENGRKIYESYRFKDLICELSNISSLYMNITKSVNFEFLGIEFKLKRKKSGMYYPNRMTYSEMVIDEKYNNKLDMDLKQLQEDYKESLRQEIKEKDSVEKNNVENFIKKLSDFGMTINQFKELNNNYDNLTWGEKTILNKRIDGENKNYIKEDK
jgi:hypothetical protein